MIKFIILLLLLFISIINCNIKSNFNGFEKNDYTIINAEENLNYIFPKPKFSTFKIKGKSDDFKWNNKHLIFDITSKIEFQDESLDWTKYETDQVRKYYKKVFTQYPIDKNNTKSKLIQDNYYIGSTTNQIVNNIIIKRVPTMSDIEYSKTFNDSIPFGFNENYEIFAAVDELKIYCNSRYGAMHSFKTLLQSGNLIQVTGGGKNGKGLVKKMVLTNLPFSIIDRPRMNYRGLLIDTGRHYLTIGYIKQIIDTVSLLKINVIHWHITDDQSFPIEIKGFPLLTQKGSNHLGYIHNNISTKSNNSMVYNIKDIKNIVGYANSVGVRIIPEIDLPGHTLSWGKGYGNLTSKCPNLLQTRKNDINLEYTYSLPLDPTNEFTYTVIDAVLRTLRKSFTDPYIHLGFDEIQIACWIQDENIKKLFKSKYGISDPNQYLAFFVNKVNQIVHRLNINGIKKNVIMWEDVLSMIDTDEHENYFGNGGENGNYPHVDNVLFQLWKGRDEYDRYLKNEKRSFIYSHGNYLDPSYQACDSFTECLLEQEELIQEFEKSKLLIGLEACAWEMIPRSNVKSIEKDGKQVDRGYPDRVWNRLFGIAEKMWSTPKPYLSSLPLDSINKIKTNSIIRANKFTTIIDSIINNQDLITSKNITNKLY